MNYHSEKNIFNLLDGQFQVAPPTHPHFISAPLSGFFASLLTAEYSFALNVSTAERRLLLNYLLEYYNLHMEGFGNIKSHKILEQIWEG